MMADKTKVWFDAEADFLEVAFPTRLATKRPPPTTP
jgi:hypothetical protein